MSQDSVDFRGWRSQPPHPCKKASIVGHRPDNYRSFRKVQLDGVKLIDRGERNVTIAVGFVCDQGVVVAADTKEGYGEAEHTYVNKIELVRQFMPVSHRPQSEAAYAAIVGSGEAYIIDYIVPRIKQAFIDSVGADISTFRQALTELMPGLYASDAIASYPHSDPVDLYTQFLVAARPKRYGEAALFLVNSSLVTQVPGGAVVIGYGPMQELARELWGLGLNLEQTSLASLYLVYEAKRRYSQVGGFTHVYVLPHRGVPVGEQIRDQGTKELLFARLRSVHHQIILTAGNRQLSAKEYSAAMRVSFKSLRAIREEFQSIERRIWNEYDAQARVQGKDLMKMIGFPSPKKSAPKK